MKSSVITAAFASVAAATLALAVPAHAQRGEPVSQTEVMVGDALP